MKLKLFYLFLFIYSISFSQSYQSLIHAADSLYRNKEYSKSADAYKAAFAIKDKDLVSLYNGACSAALAGNEKLALGWLKVAVQNGWKPIMINL